VNRAVSDREEARKLLYREAALRFDAFFADTTCVKANIHFPVDWVLFRDATRTLIKAIQLIRSHGLRHRIRDPKYFITVTHETHRIPRKQVLSVAGKLLGRD
jgi:hypothetical protein